MKKNIGTIDRIASTLIAALIAFLFFTNQITGTPWIILIIFAAVFLQTSFISICPLVHCLVLKPLEVKNKFNKNFDCI